MVNNLNLENSAIKFLEKILPPSTPSPGVDWRGFEKNLEEYFTNVNSNRSIKETAQRLTNYYFNAVMGGQTIFGNKVMYINKKALENAFRIAFTLQSNSKKDLGMLCYYIIAFGVIRSWSTAKLSPLPPVPPSVLPSPIPNSCTVLFPGSPLPLGTFLQIGFSKFTSIKTPKLSAKFISLALQFHLKTVSGIYIGLMPTAVGPVPSPPIPWVGIF